VPGNSKISPYLRTAIGVNTWKQDYTDTYGNKLLFPNQLPELAYQVGIGAKFNLSKRAGIFIEGGYGKYILHSGVAFKF
jgi:outer membrane protease